VLLDELNTFTLTYGMEVNVKKTNIMCMSQKS